MELLIMLDAFKRSSATRVTAVMPYYGYARQDKKDKPRVPITAKLVADLISRAGADRVLTMDLHAAQIQGFFDMPVDHLFAAPVLLDAIRDMGIPDLVIVSPDAGGVERARAIAKRLDVDLAIVDKRRTAPNEAEVMNVIGDVRGRDVLIVDDIIDTAGTLMKTVDALHEQGARRILAAGIHGVLSGPALERIERLAARGAAGHRHHADRRQAGEAQQAARPVGRAAARRGDPPHPRQQLGDLALRLTRARRYHP